MSLDEAVTYALERVDGTSAERGASGSCRLLRPPPAMTLLTGEHAGPEFQF